MMLCNFKLHYFPSLTCGWFILTFIVTYAIAVAKGHVYPIFPYISETGTMPPESCIFSQMLNVGAVLMFLNNYIRYRQIDFGIKSKYVNLSKKWNTVAVWIGTIVSVGISVVGNFQQTNMFVMHMIGATMSFGLAAIYFIIQTRISFAFQPMYHKFPRYRIGRWVVYFRLILTVLYVTLFVMIFTFGRLGFKEFQGTNLLWWTEQDGGHTYRVTSTFSEWGLFFVMVMYVFTGTFEFKTVTFKDRSGNCLASSESGWKKKQHQSDQVTSGKRG
ncbi:hypothetical protein RN001_006611 [Aquatica leii]|uniref:CWH43-like N-terminal domain-containing protein n=1 Tax=Aquatica leii TaxID=1421715 RepID=A0AAN7SIP4_9COLE|nr:hypothetical protein RN001_006611 [Aquatica leii]